MWYSSPPRLSFLPFPNLLLGIVFVAGCGEEPTASTPPLSASPELATASLGSWTTKVAMPTPRAGLAGAVVQNASGQYLFYAIGGSNENNSAMRRVEAYNAATNSWSRRANLPFDRTSASAAAIAGKIYLVGGFNLTGVLTRTLYVYTQATNTWTKKASLPVGGNRAISGVIGGKLYVVTGDVNGSRLYRYDPATDAWTRRADPQKTHVGGIGGVIDGKLYVAWGRTFQTTDPYHASFTVDVYNPATNQWTTKLTYAYAGGLDGQGLCDLDIDIDCGVSSPAGVVFQKKLYVTGGGNDDETMPLTSAYDPIANTWTDKADLHFPRESRPIAGSVRNAAGSARIVVTGGFAEGEPVGETEMYTP